MKLEPSIIQEKNRILVMNFKTLFFQNLRNGKKGKNQMAIYSSFLFDFTKEEKKRKIQGKFVFLDPRLKILRSPSLFFYFSEISEK